MTTSDKAIRKASGDRLLRDFARAARLVSVVQRDVRGFATDGSTAVLWTAQNETSRTRYACLMTAFGK